MRILLLLTLFFISSSVKSQNLKCTDFKNGTFKIQATNYNIPSTTVNRSGNIQKEMSVSSDKEFEGKIEWISECGYELIYMKASAEMIGKKSPLKSTK